MDYTEWIEHVASSLAEAWNDSDAKTQILGLEINDIAKAAGISLNDAIGMESISDALKDLTNMSLLEQKHRRFTLTQEGRKLGTTRIDTSWDAIFETFLDDQQMKFLQILSSLSVDTHPNYSRLLDVDYREVLARMTVNEDENPLFLASNLVSSLRTIGFVRDRTTMGAISVHPSYLGVVRSTKEESHRLASVVRSAIPDWETTNVDFKRSLKLSTEKERSEFVRDILSLANTKSSGPRFLIVGFDNESRAFQESVDDSISQERMEQILQSWAAPPPRITFARVPWEGGTVGLIEVFRSSVQLPYKANKSVSKLVADVIYVRHGSHTEPATDAEAESLIAEGDRARRAEIGNV